MNDEIKEVIKKDLDEVKDGAWKDSDEGVKEWMSETGKNDSDEGVNKELNEG